MTLYAGSTSLLLHGDGADGSTAFTDETGKTVTPYGNAHISTAQSNFGGSSMYFDGDGDFLSVPHSADLNLSGGDFTVEAWIWLTAYSSGNAQIVDKDGVAGGSYSQYNINVTAAGKLSAFVGNGAGISPSGTTITGVTTLPLAVWHHVALVKFGATIVLFLNGVQEASAVSPTLYDGGKPLLVGYQNGQPASVYFNGYIDDLRITKGIALYPADFTSPSAPVGFSDPIPVQIQQQDPGLHKLAKYDPTQAKPVISEVKDDLQDRLPYGPWKTPAVQLEFKGRGVITGTVAEKALPANTPLRRLVRLHREPDGAFVKAVWSDAVTGNYTFNGVRADHKYFVTSFDHTGTYRAVIADNLTPDILP